MIKIDNLKSDGTYLIMITTNRNVIFMAMVMLCIILMTVLTGIIIIPEENAQLPGDDVLAAGNFAAAWFSIPVPQLSFLLMLLMLGMSIFAFLIVYLGGRSNHRRFNDRTVDSMNLFVEVFSRRLYLEPSLFSCSAHLIRMIRACTGMESHSSNHLIVLRRY